MKESQRLFCCSFVCCCDIIPRCIVFRHDKIIPHMSSHVNILNALLSSAICALVRSRNPWIMNKDRFCRDLEKYSGCQTCLLSTLALPAGLKQAFHFLFYSLTQYPGRSSQLNAHKRHFTSKQWARRAHIRCVKGTPGTHRSTGTKGG